MSKRSGFYPCPAVDGAGTQVVSQAGAVLLTDTLVTVGLDRVLSTALGPWRPRWAVHDPAKVLLDLALGLAIGGDCLADVGVLRAEPGVFGLVAAAFDAVFADVVTGVHPVHADPTVVDGELVLALCGGLDG